MSEYELPIDIHTSKLLDWLISRKHCTKSWKAGLDKIREKIRAAIKDMPENEQIQRILSKHTFNYFICKQIIEILKETEKHSKNLFGYYSSQRMKDWQEIVQMYEKDGIYLAELASTLIRNVTYEVPNLKKTISRMQQLHDEYNRKQDEHLKQSAALRKEYNAMAASHGLNGSNIEEDLELLFGEVPVVLAELEQETHRVRAIRELYLSFIAKINEQDTAGVLPLLGYLLDRGNTTYFEYANGVKPVQVIEDKLDLKSKKSSEDCARDEDKIDFGDEIDFGEDAQIDFGDQIDFGTEDKIDFGEEKDGVASQNVAPNEQPNVARGKDALTILEHFRTRNLILNELNEIEAFLQQRLVESRSKENSLIASQLEESPELVDLFDVNFLESKRSTVQHIIELLNQDKIKMLCLIKDNEKYLDTILQKFNHKLHLVERAARKAEEMQAASATCVSKIDLIKPQIPILIEATREIQTFIQNEISGFYKNRPVNLMGAAQIL